ncbi:solute:sodium symporter family transporter [Clostridium botulinum]|uniref:Na+/solute symporter n=1 Tax=Clostridium botulinum D str. 1873 TaxID=592027 RepID=A0A9P2LKJ2_CLOBO|nr:solute:sodium symporter family transporter [Clostridium botulinum]MBO3441091.1 solute:sodium symporter family transporter [Clostridium haemolyticum]MCD3245720.1 solute:sodium symporter family transporter [Clostridium botulinum C]EES90416.1 Na+/solute symporter [Clostridium botulinum D str. 1873]MCD3262214.1 solute:sodium symporter family transporter [Clostridium botulinum C]NFV47034.1 solute:sodium symporter family transporter [Clostridium botulinum]
MSIWTVASFIGFTVLVAVISWYKTKDDNLDTQDGYFLGGRSLTGIVIGGSLMLTNLSTEQMVGLNGNSYLTNMGPMAWEATSTVALVILALVFLPKYLKSGITTIPDFLEERYDKKTKQIISVLFLIGYVVTYLPTVLYSGAIVLNEIFGIQRLLAVSQFKAVAITATAIGIIGAIYAIFGGLKAVAVSDTVNGVGLLIGGLSIPVFALIVLGHGSFSAGIHTLVTVHPEKLNAINPANSQKPLVPWPVLFTGLLFNNLFYWCTNQSIVQRCFGGKNLKEAQKGALFAGFLKLLGPFFLVLPGIIAFHLYGNTLEKGDLAYPKLVLDVLPTPLLGFFAAVLFGAILSSFNSALNSAVTLYTLDIHRPVFNPKATDAELVQIGKKFGTVLAVLSISIAPFIIYAPSGLYGYLQECFGFYNVPILAAVIVGFFSKKVPAIAPKIALISHVVLYTISKFVASDIHFLYVLGVLFPVNVMIMLVVGKMQPRKTDYVQKYTKQVDITPWKHAKTVSFVSICIMLLVYALFSKIGIGA